MSVAEDFLTTEYSASMTVLLSYWDGLRVDLLPNSFMTNPIKSINAPATNAIAHAPSNRINPKTANTIFNKGFLGLFGRVNNNR